MESTLQNPALAAARTTPKAKTIVYWTVTALFCLEMGFTAYYMLLHLPEGAPALIRLGFPSYFRVELAWAKLIGVVVLLAPAPARLKEWAYAGFAIDLTSALIAEGGHTPESVYASGRRGISAVHDAVLKGEVCASRVILQDSCPNRTRFALFTRDNLSLSFVFKHIVGSTFIFDIFRGQSSLP